MIIGLGTDIVNIERINRSLQKFGTHFTAKILTSAEQQELTAISADARKSAAKVAKLFAAKEAAAKALGTGFNNGISWQEISVTHDDRGKPLLCLSGQALARANALAGGRNYACHLSISDDFPFAQAVVIIEIL